MIKIENTENLTGVSISGDFNDLDKLVDVFHEITIDEYSEKYIKHIGISTRVLGLCYDVRHTYQGDREIDFVDNGMDEEKMKYHSVIAPLKNVYYKCNYLYPEMFFVIIALNELVKVRIRELNKSNHVYNEPLDKNVIWDDTIATIRCFQAAFMKCVKDVLTKASFTRWLNLMNGDYINIEEIAGQYVDVQNIKYINMTKEVRLKNLVKITKRITEFRFDADYREIKDVVSEAAKERKCCEGDINLVGIEYPDEIVW